MDYQYLLDAVSAGKDAVVAFQAGRKWTAVRHVGRGLVAVGSFGESSVGPTAPLIQSGTPQTDTFERRLAENDGDAFKAAEAVFVEVERAVNSNRQGAMDATGDFATKRPVLAALLNAALKALLAALI